MTYQHYRASVTEWLLFIAEYCIVCALCGYLFFDSVWGAIALMPGFVFYIKMRKAICLRKQNQQIWQQFMALISCIGSSVAAGYSPENAFLRAIPDMKIMYGEKALIVRELQKLQKTLQMKGRLSDYLYDFAARTDMEDVWDFALVFSAAQKSGGSFREVISSCILMMQAKRDTQQDIAGRISGKKLEARVMCSMPFLMIAYLRLTNSEYMEVLYHNPIGVVLMLGCLLMFVVGIVISEKITDIKV